MFVQTLYVKNQQTIQMNYLLVFWKRKFNVVQCN